MATHDPGLSFIAKWGKSVADKGVLANGNVAKMEVATVMEVAKVSLTGSATLFMITTNEND